MFFEKEIVSFHILDVLKLNQKNVSYKNGERNFNAMSYRIRANARLISANCEHRLESNSVAYVPSRLNYTRIADFDEMIVIHFESKDYRTEEIECFAAKNPEKMQALFEDILAVWNNKEPGYKYRCAAIFYEILEECYIQNYKPDIRNSKIQNSVEYLQKNFASPDLTIDEIAKKSYVSEVYFRKLFKREYGISPQKYIISLRIQNAKGLIATGYYSLEEVAYLSGYSDCKYFSVEFKKFVGVSPSEYHYNFRRGGAAREN